jgi:hypothetical protein
VSSNEENAGLRVTNVFLMAVSANVQQRFAWPSSSINNENMEHVCNFARSDRQKSILEISAEVGILVRRLHNILHKDLSCITFVNTWLQKNTKSYTLRNTNDSYWRIDHYGWSWCWIFKQHNHCVIAYLKALLKNRDLRAPRKLLKKQWGHWEKYRNMVSANVSKALRTLAKAWHYSMRCKITYFCVTNQFRQLVEVSDLRRLEFQESIGYIIPFFFLS